MWHYYPNCRCRILHTKSARFLLSIFESLLRAGISAPTTMTAVTTMNIEPISPVAMASGRSSDGVKPMDFMYFSWAVRFSARMSTSGSGSASVG